MAACATTGEGLDEGLDWLREALEKKGLKRGGPTVLRSVGNVSLRCSFCQLNSTQLNSTQLNSTQLKLQAVLGGQTVLRSVGNVSLRCSFCQLNSTQLKLQAVSGGQTVLRSVCNVSLRCRTLCSMPCSMP